MHRVHDCIISDEQLDKLTRLFVPHQDAYYFNDDELCHSLLKRGIPVFTREEFHGSFPTFGLLYGSVYMSWQIPKDRHVTLMNDWQLDKLNGTLRERLLKQQVECGRGHVYEIGWLDGIELPPHNTVQVEGKWHYLLTCDDWHSFTDGTRRSWMLKWLTEYRRDEPQGTADFTRDIEQVPYSIVDDYAGRFAEHCGPNCFAAAIAMMVGRISENESRAVIQQWLHQAPFFRLIDAQGYSAFIQCHEIGDLTIVQPADVLVWYTGDGTAAHAAFVVSNGLVFQKHGQAFQDPWQVLRIEDVWYNEYFKTGGWITVYRSDATTR